MTEQACLQYLENPEANAEHLAACADCRALAAGLEPEVDGAATMSLDALPLAPWEGAAHRSWPLVIGGALIVLVIAVALLAFAGFTPVTAEMSRLDMLRSFLRLAPNAVQSAPREWQVAIGIAFVVVNTLLYLLLRRAPRGVDA